MASPALEVGGYDSDSGDSHIDTSDTNESRASNKDWPKPDGWVPAKPEMMPARAHAVAIWDDRWRVKRWVGREGEEGVVPRSPPIDHGADIDEDDFQYCQYIPVWTSPLWPEDSVRELEEFDDARQPLKTPEGQPITRKWPRRDVTQRIRPALLPMDKIKNPTEYALRYGINPDAPKGRSRMSPLLSSTRRIGLSTKRATPTGIKDFVTIQDQQQDTLNFGADGNLVSRLERGEIPEDHPSFEQATALRDLRNMLIDDHNWQRFFYGSVTTDELQEHNADPANPANPEVVCELKGELHPLLDRWRWDSNEREGKAAARPKFFYNLGGVRGRYDGTDDFLWAALQPALQLATRMLKSDHPYWSNLGHFYNRNMIDPSRDPYMFADPTKVWARVVGQDVILMNMHDIEHDEGTWEEAPVIAKLKGLDIKFEEIIGRSMRKRLRFHIRSAYNMSSDDKNLAEHSAPTWGECCWNNGDYLNGAISLCIACEGVWPLLCPEISRTEKAFVSWQLATTICHELAHCWQWALMGMCQFAVQCRAGEFSSNFCQELKDLTDEQIKAVAELKDYVVQIDDRSDIEPYYRSQVMSELGWAAEQELWGLALEQGVEMYTPKKGFSAAFPHYALYSGLTKMFQWPSQCNEKDQKAEVKLPEAGHMLPMGWLLWPPLPLGEYNVRPTVPRVTRLFTDEFWETSMGKYGHRALHMAEPEPSKNLSRVKFGYVSYRDGCRSFGGYAWSTFGICQNLLARSDQLIVFEWMDALLKEAIGFHRLRRLWSYEEHAWENNVRKPIDGLLLMLNQQLNWILRQKRQLDDAMSGHYIIQHTAIVQHNHDCYMAKQKLNYLEGKPYVAKFTPAEIAMLEAMTGAERTEMRKTRDRPQPQSWHDFVILKTAEINQLIPRIIDMAAELRRLLRDHLVWVQTIVVDYLKLRVKWRKKMWKRYMVGLHGRIKDFLHPACERAHTALKTVAEVSSALKNVDAIEAEVLTEGYNVANMLGANFKSLLPLLDKAYIHQRGLPLEAATIFSTLDEAAFRRRAKSLEKLAMKEITMMPRSLRDVVRVMIRCIDRYGKMPKYDWLNLALSKEFSHDDFVLPTLDSAQHPAGALASSVFGPFTDRRGAADQQPQAFNIQTQFQNQLPQAPVPQVNIHNPTGPFHSGISHSQLLHTDRQPFAAGSSDRDGIAQAGPSNQPQYIVPHDVWTEVHPLDPPRQGSVHRPPRHTYRHNPYTRYMLHNTPLDALPGRSGSPGPIDLLPPPSDSRTDTVFTPNQGPFYGPFGHPYSTDSTAQMDQNDGRKAKGLQNLFGNAGHLGPQIQSLERQEALRQDLYRAGVESDITTTAISLADDGELPKEFENGYLPKGWPWRFNPDTLSP
ncbi:hypothetical protein OQA88_2262 [Cercophora sp. LCS_1]